MINTYFSTIINSGILGTVSLYLLILLPVAVPIMLLYGVWTIRYRWLTMKYVSEQKSCLIEIRLPKEITKSPAAMEIFFTYFAQRGADNFGEAFVDGKTRPWFSCEIVSTGGAVRFFIWISESKFRNIIETQLYAQYPNLEIFEAEDYTKDFYFDPENYPMVGGQYSLSKPDPFPIKTYIDYGLGLSEDQKEEYKIDPITSVIEYMGSLKAGENAWMQILVRKHEPEIWKHGLLTSDVNPKKANFLQKIIINLFGSSKDLKGEIKEQVEKIRKEAIPEGDEQTTFKFPNPTKGQIEVISALERSATKTPFDCMIRTVYIAKKDSFVPINVSGLIGGLKQYGSSNLNGFKPTYTEVEEWEKDLGRFIPFFQKHMDEKTEQRKRDTLYSYKLRSYFEGPYKYYGRVKPTFQLWGYDKGENKPFVLTTEELATIFHFPSGMVSQTPTLQRVPSKKSEAPSNLPI